MRKLIVECPLNSLSFGQVSFNILRELHKRDIDLIVFPIGNIDISAYKVSTEFKKWLQNAITRRLTDIRRDIPVLKLWHLNGSHQKISDKNYLLTFYECDSPTPEEVNMVNLQDHVFFGSKYNVDVFSTTDVNPAKISSIPMGFDPDFGVTEKLATSDKIEFALIGKWEKRKNTTALIRSWVRKYGNSKKHSLNLAVTNPFLDQGRHNELMSNALEGRVVNNLNFVQYMKSNAEVNQLMNFIDIDIGGMSSAEGWNLPSFHMTGLGKWSTVLNATAHCDWATTQNSILLEPNGMQQIYDNVFFQKGLPFNQGNSYTYNEDQFIAALEIAEKKAKTVNTEGLKIQTDFTWQKSVDQILAKIFA